MFHFDIPTSTWECMIINNYYNILFKTIKFRRYLNSTSSITLFSYYELTVYNVFFNLKRWTIFVRLLQWLTLLQAPQTHRIIQEATEWLHASLRSILQRPLRAESAGHAAAEAAIPGRQKQAGAQEQRQEAAGLDTKQRARGKRKNHSLQHFFIRLDFVITVVHSTSLARISFGRRERY